MTAINKIQLRRLCSWLFVFYCTIGFSRLAAAESRTIKILFSCPTSTIEEFRAFAASAKQLGATHIDISELPKSRWQWDLDRRDPYPNWGMRHASIFKIVVPPELAPFLPLDYARKNLDIISKRGAILNELGLKASFSGKEPCWLPEKVFQAHPEWRGPRCEQPRRARNTYYAPCIDRPEILAMYRKAVAALCRQAPIEWFSFLTNDSGGGICWSVSLYPGQNGPAWCESRTLAERVVGFFSTIQSGAQDAGLVADVSFSYGSGYISGAEIASIIPKLMAGQSINGQNRDGAEPIVGVGYSAYDSAVWPVLSIPQIILVAEQLDAAMKTKNTDISFYFYTFETELFELIKQYRQNPGTGIIHRARCVRAVAVDQVGEENADLLVSAWERIYKAVMPVKSLPEPVLMVGSVNQRWITRPFVPFPMELTDEEKDYYRKFQFQANSEAEAADLMNMQGHEAINGYSGSMMASRCFDSAIAHLRAAVRDLQSIAETTKRKEIGEKISLLQMRLKTLVCIYRNARNAVKYQDILDRTDYSTPPVEENIWPMDGDQKLREIQNITRDEIDNTYELVGLLKEAPVPLLFLAPNQADEDVMQIGPDIIQQLHKKIAIMVKHQLDVHRLYKRRQS